MFSAFKVASVLFFKRKNQLCGAVDLSFRGLWCGSIHEGFLLSNLFNFPFSWHSLFYFEAISWHLRFLQSAALPMCLNHILSFSKTSESNAWR